MDRRRVVGSEVEFGNTLMNIGKSLAVVATYHTVVGPSTGGAMLCASQDCRVYPVSAPRGAANGHERIVEGALPGLVRPRKAFRSHLTKI
jgi:hypothetical protein